MDYLDLILPISLILSGVYFKLNKAKDINTPKSLWLILVILGLVNLVLKLYKYTMH